jgi:tripartite ATP-independent transporter DctP family solute receptor
LLEQPRIFPSSTPPYLFNDEREADAILDGPVGERLLAKLPEKGLIGLGYFEFGFRNFLNSRRPILTAEDLKGLKIRVTQAPVYIDFISALGANPTPLGIPELYTALEQGAVDGMDTPLSFVRLQKYDEVQKYLVLSRHVYNAQIILLSRKTWDRLSDDERKVLTDAAREARDYQRRVSREQDVAELETLKKSMRVTELPPTKTAKLRDKANVVGAKYSGALDPLLVETFKVELEKVRNGK